MIRRLRILSENDRERIHRAALDVLERRGVRVEDPRLRAEMRARGATTHTQQDEVRIPRELVAECLETVERKPVLECVNGKVLHLYGENRYYGSLVTDPYIVDYREGLRRPRLDDIARHARLGDALRLVDNIYRMDAECSDVDRSVVNLKTLEAFVANTTTSYHCAPSSMESARHWVEVSEIMAGGSLREHPLLMGYIPSISPLILAKSNTDQTRYFIEHGVVLRIGPCAISGATAPYPVAGLVVLSWAECLALIVAVQTIRPGEPACVSSGGHEMDMLGGTSLYSGPVKDLSTTAIMELCEDFDLPSADGNYSTLCSNYGFQNGLESMMGAFIPFFARNHLAGGMGSLANACGMSAVQLVLNHDLTEMLERVAGGIDTREEMLSVESIVNVGPGGDFLTEESTLQLLRSEEHFFPPCYERCVGGEDRKTMAERAYERAEEIMASHEPAVPEERLEEVRRYIRDPK